MHCPNCGIIVPTDQRFCRACGLGLPEFSELLSEKIPTPNDDLRSQKRKIEKWGLRLWTAAGAILYIALYWTIISEIIIGKGHVLGGVLFLLVITAISLGGLLILYSAALKKRSGRRRLDKPGEMADTARGLLANPPAELPTSVTEHTTELLETDNPKEAEDRSFEKLL